MSAEVITPDELEAKVRRLMAVNAGIEVRGWDGMAARAQRLTEIDAALDNYNQTR